MPTLFKDVYSNFLSKITDDMYMELTPMETERMLKELLLNSLHWFEFPRVNIYDYDIRLEEFNIVLSTEEQNIIATYMVVGWIDQQLASVENTRMKYSGSDFKFTSQANHMHKLLQMRKDYERQGFHLQRLYKRRKADVNGIMRPTMHTIMQPIDFASRSKCCIPDDCGPVRPKPPENKPCQCDDVAAEVELNEF